LDDFAGTTCEKKLRLTTSAGQYQNQSVLNFKISWKSHHIDEVDLKKQFGNNAHHGII